MKIEDQLKHLILGQYKSLTAFAAAIEMPYTTLDSLLKRGIDTANFSRIRIIAKKLGVDVDKLGDGEIVPYEKTEEAFTVVEKELIKIYRTLDERGQSSVMDTARREQEYVARFCQKPPPPSDTSK